MRTFFLAPTRYGVGLTSVTLGLVRALDNLGLRVKFFKPIAQLHVGDTGPERSTKLVQRIMDHEPPTPIASHRAEDLLGDNKGDVLMEEIVALFEQASQDCDVMVVEGLVPTREMPYANRLNSNIAKTINADIILVSEPGNDSLADLADKLEIAADSFGGIKNPNVVGYALNKLTPEAVASLNKDGHFQSLPEFARKPFQPLGYIPFDNNLASPRTMDIAEHLKADIINAGEMDTRRVTSYTLSARTPTNMIHHLKPGNLVITPGDRDDIILATCMAALNGVPLAGLLLTSGITPSKPVMELCSKAIGTGLPVMMTGEDSYTTATMLDRRHNELPVDDAARVELVMDTIAANLNTGWLKQQCSALAERRLSPPAFRYQLVQRAQGANKRIVLPEGDEPRTIQAAVICQERGIAQCILLGQRSVIEQVAKDNGITLPDGLIIMEPDSIRARYVDPMVELRKNKGLTAPMAEAQLEDTVVLGTMMLALNEVDGLVSGAVHTTANTIRPAFQLVKTKKDAGGLVSSVFFMLLPDQVLVYGDCAVNPNPDAEQLANIAIQSADSATAFGIEPRIAMISYSTGTSGIGADVEKVREATEIVKAKRPDLIIDGPLQYDAASVESVAQSKAPGSNVAGRATVFIFPDLNTGNTTYKAVQRSADVISVGPMLQGLNKPVNDLSRGALVDDIVYTIALTAIQAEND
ncbi:MULTISPECIES: phosphate acetyltransferase [Gammaproteobacteria]|uniref:phosphate acetyltransferase n=1 Tax=Gammaproteobacteria TaxID=1236 RepID=UPI001ADC2F33|nr:MULTISPECIES: phosphate acetyltransferase [Gammaproteobacteria]MBO9481617.1 phosphate acetyltransferase [Salinisphaera sp. G21_0]MBO9493206.1 phosphate acetyltransferase [Thalassotalea sp. G20_0]